MANRFLISFRQLLLLLHIIVLSYVHSAHAQVLDVAEAVDNPVVSTFTDRGGLSSHTAVYPRPAQIGDRTGTFQPGDAVRITIWREPQLSADYSISSNGTVQLPLIGKVQVKGLTTLSLTSFLKAEYGAYLREPDIQVVPLMRVAVLGGVGSPGLYRVEPESSLWDLLATAGGPIRGRSREMHILRGGRVVIKDILGAYERGDSLVDVGIRSGDQIMVPTKEKFGIRRRSGVFTAE